MQYIAELAKLSVKEGGLNRGVLVREVLRSSKNAPFAGLLKWRKTVD